MSVYDTLKPSHANCRQVAANFSAVLGLPAPTYVPTWRQTAADCGYAVLWHVEELARRQLGEGAWTVPIRQRLLCRPLAHVSLALACGRGGGCGQATERGSGGEASRHRPLAWTSPRCVPALSLSLSLSISLSLSLSLSLALSLSRSLALSLSHSLSLSLSHSLTLSRIFVACSCISLVFRL